MPTRVSIITPSYNQAAFLEQTIRSVFGQGYSNLEYIIVDGYSTDGSLKIIQKYSDQLSWWVSEPDKGQADAINKGFSRATGDVVAWLNSDDMYAPGAIAEAVKYLDDNPDVGLIYGNAVSFDQDGHPLNDMTFADWGLDGLVAFNIICQPAVFIRRDVLEQAGYLDEKYHMMLDHQLWLRIAQLTKIKHIPKLWAFARHHAGAKNVAQAPKFGEEAFRVFEWMQTQPDLAEIITRNRSTTMAMLYRFDGRYQLDGGRVWPALKSYLRAFLFSPGIALQEWHRILYAKLSLIGLGKLGQVYYQSKKKRLPASIQELSIDNINHLYNDIYCE
jgi:glycosyltransferase involved in cell wall biosynthesis